MHLHLSQVVDQPRRRRVLEVDAALARWLLDRRVCRGGAQQIEPVGAAEARRDRAQIGRQGRDIVLAHREQRPAAAVAQRGAHLRKEDGLGSQIGRLDRQDLLELVEDQHLAVALARPWPLIEVVRQR